MNDDHPLLVAINAEQDRITAHLVDVAETLRGDNAREISDAWDAATAQVRATSRALLSVDPEDADSHQVASLAARYLDLALWMHDNHPRPVQNIDGHPMVVRGWQEAVSGPDGYFWTELMSFYRDAMRIAGRHT